MRYALGILLLVVVVGCGGAPCDPGYRHVGHHCSLIDAGASDTELGRTTVNEPIEQAGRDSGATRDAGPSSPTEPVSAGRAAVAGRTAESGAGGEPWSRLPLGGTGGAGGSAGSAAESAPRCGNGMVETGEKCDGDCPSSCPLPKGCMVWTPTGSSSTCDFECVSTTIATKKAGDGCCPEGANATDDSDCPKSCGDGIVQEPETCEPKSKDKPCPSSCDDGDPCTMDTMSGSAAQCTAECAHTPMTRKSISCDDGDPCTMDSSVASSTSCTYECKNTSVPRMGSSSCDDGNPCTMDSSVASSTSCTYECKNTPTPGAACGGGKMCTSTGACEAPPPRCGDGKVDSGEKCDGNCPSSSDCDDGNPCTDDSIDGSASQCNATCKHSNIGSGTRNACGGCKTLEHQKGSTCSASLQSCTNRGTYECQGTDTIVCNAKMPTTSTEVCDNVDNNCNGQVDEGVLNECGGCGKPHYEPQAVPPGKPCAYYWTEDNSGDCATTGVGKCVGLDTVICDAPKPACAP